MYDNLLSFVSNSDLGFIEPTDDNIEPGSIWDKLMKAITKVVKNDGIRRDTILSNETVASVTTNAVENIYYDVEGLHYWYFDPEDERNQFMKYQKAATILSPLRNVVKPVVEYVLDDMRDADLIPLEKDTETLVDSVTDGMTKYILNWQDWYYDRKDSEDEEDYWMSKSIYESIYADDYGDMTNSTNYLDDDINSPEGY